jgi:transcription antitermination protein NusB
VTSDPERVTAERGRAEVWRRGREAAIQMLYQWEVGRSAMYEVTSTFWTEAPKAEADPATEEPTPPPAADASRQFAEELARGVADAVSTLDPLISEAAEHWRIERMAVIDRLILRVAVYEFLHRPATPARVVINEALELGRMFSTDDAVRFINGILDGIRRSMGRE